MIYNIGIISLLSNNQIKKQIFKLITILLITFVIVNLSGVVHAVTLQKTYIKLLGKNIAQGTGLKMGNQNIAALSTNALLRHLKIRLHAIQIILRHGMDWGMPFIALVVMMLRFRLMIRHWTLNLIVIKQK